MTEWHIKVMGEVSGPFSFEELRQLCSTNTITFDTLVRPTMGQWKTADHYPELFENESSNSSSESLEAAGMTQVTANEMNAILQEADLEKKRTSLVGRVVEWYRRQEELAAETRKEAQKAQEEIERRNEKERQRQLEVEARRRKEEAENPQLAEMRRMNSNLQSLKVIIAVVVLYFLIFGWTKGCAL